jgi:hypothetical protein
MKQITSKEEIPANMTDEETADFWAIVDELLTNSTNK